MSRSSERSRWTSPTELEYAVTHVFLPAHSVAKPVFDITSENDCSLAFAVSAAATAFGSFNGLTPLGSLWYRIANMLGNLGKTLGSKHPAPGSVLDGSRPHKLQLDEGTVISQLCEMQTGGICAFLNRSQGAAVFFRKQDHCTLYESFQMPGGSLSTFMGLYPECAVEIPDEVFRVQSFQANIANCLIYSRGIPHQIIPSAKAMPYARLLTNIMKIVGRTAEVPRVTKHIHTYRTSVDMDWSRSPIWLLIKVAIQTSLERDGFGGIYYKTFMLYFMCRLAEDAVCSQLPSRLLHVISAKILRRLKKLGSYSPDWLCGMVLQTNTSLREIIEAGWKVVDATLISPTLWKPTLLDLDRDTQLLLLGSAKYIRNSLTNLDQRPPDSLFCPKHLPRGTLDDFLSSKGSFFDIAYRCDPYVALYDVERAVEQGIGDWIHCITDIDQACVQIQILMDKYLSNASSTYGHNPEHMSVMLLTAVELWVAVDKLVIGASPMLIDYSPGVPIELLRRPLICKAMDLFRLSRAYEYLSARHSQVLPGHTLFSDKMEKSIFFVRYNVNSPDLWNHIEGSIRTVPPQVDIAVFELGCPMHLHVWRTCTAHLLDFFHSCHYISPYGGSVLDISWLQRYLVKQWTSPITGHVYLTCVAPRGLQPWNIFRNFPDDPLRVPVTNCFAYQLPQSCSLLQQYCCETTHTCNDILASQTDCPINLSSVHEFIAFGQLRSGGSLQWLNILRELRSRTLNFRLRDNYFLLARTVSQAGPLDLRTGELEWHEELQESSFCFALLSELESLFIDVAVHSMDSVMMGTISLLLTRLLTSSAHEDASQRTIQLLRLIRRKTFDWVLELSYNLMMAPTNVERSELLRDMAATCRSTFNVGPDVVHKLLQSAADVDALLSCAILVHANGPIDSQSLPEYSRLLLERDRCLSLALERVLRDTILGDESDKGIDLAVRNVWSSYLPGPRRWRALPHPNCHWLACETAAIGRARSQTVHLNLLDGTLLVDRKPIDQLPSEIRKHPTYKRIFGDQRFLVIASDLPGMEFSTLAMISEHRVHFALRDDDLVIRAQLKDAIHILELIPHTKLQGDLPKTMINDHVHWLNPSTSIIEIRPLDKLWEHSQTNWKINCTSGGYYMRNGQECLIDIQSETCKMVSSVLKCLDVPENLIITTIPTETLSSRVRQLSVVLPRYGLSFFVNEEGELESCDFKNMVYDERQHIGTLFGLESQLILRPKIQIEPELGRRCTIIPDGKFSREEWNRHIRIRIDTDVMAKVIKYHIYYVDTDLGRLASYTSWRAKLYLACLHIETSIDWRPDSLTGRTGIQEALRLLRSAGCRSIMELDTRYPEFLPFSSTDYKRYPQISLAIAEINYLIEKQKILHATEDSELCLPPRPELNVIGALRTAYLFPPENPGAVREFQVHFPLSWQVQLGHLFNDRSPPKMPDLTRTRLSRRGLVHSFNSNSTHILKQFFPSLRLESTAPQFQKQYIIRLHASAQHVHETTRMTYTPAEKPSIEDLQAHYVQCRENYIASMLILKEELGPKNDTLAQALDRSGQWPQTTPNDLLRCLASTSPIKLSSDWRQCLVSLALLLLELQRSRRLLQLALNGLEGELLRELENEGCDGWVAENYPDWLLIQLQGNFLIRGSQADVAMNMISPPSGKNTAMQVNMGEGKSSVILPMSVAALADGKQLVRVIVPKALTVQMFRLLVDRLGGLTNRPIYHVPFSRALTGKYTDEQFTILHSLLSECMHECGILVVQPEHVLAFKLATVEKQLSFDSQSRVPRNAFLELQTWFQSCARDVLDEIDEVIHPRFQLLYTIGTPQRMEGHPDRWTITQQILRLVKKYALSLSRDLPDDIECGHSSSGSFPHIRILRLSDASQRLVSLIVDDVMDGQLPSFTLRDIDRDRRLHHAIRIFISSKEIHPSMASFVEEYARKTLLWERLLLLRGLLACNILLFALTERRWRVDYGLSPDRTMLAVPFRAKDVPAPRAEFGHPDITILLTCLSYYYRGLTQEQLRESFRILQEQVDSSTEFASWLRDHDPDTVPNAIQKLENINIKSSEQWDKYLFPLFSRSQGAIDLYLSHFVFPKKAKEFPWKLAATNWDLVETREKLVTGFSGTNDGQDLFPTSIAQWNPNHQRGTNAKVLCHLLRTENSSYELISDVNGKRRSTLDLLRMVVNQVPRIRVFLDVGAQILDFTNEQVATQWLDLVPDCEGSVYFNEDDELMVLTRDGTHRSFLSSHLAQRLDRCVIYLDDAHTRGTDLKLSSGSRAAVTLGPKVTKDRLVQGCMRMRKLGQGHSVMFFAPPEVDRSIRSLSCKEEQNVPVTTADILHWAIRETWADIQQRAPYWAQQGINHSSRYDSWIQFCRSELTPRQMAETWLLPELKSLANLYAPSQPQAKDTLPILNNYPEIMQHCIHLGLVELPRAQLDEEQEREVNREIEREWEAKQCRPDIKPAYHSLHPDIVAFVMAGVMPPSLAGSTFCPIFTALRGSSAATIVKHVPVHPLVLATSDFCRTIEPRSCPGKIDKYLRPVQWILSGKWNNSRVLVLLSPFEANHLMPYIRLSKHVHLHVYTPRTSENMKPTDDLMFYSIPPVPGNWIPPWDLIDQVNLFAGQLYLRDHESYLRLLRLLGIQRQDLPKEFGATVRHNLITPDFIEKIENALVGSPLPSVMMLLAIRRGGMSFAETHMGRILQGQQLTKKDFKSMKSTSHEMRIQSSLASAENDGPPLSPTFSPNPSSILVWDDAHSFRDSGRPQKRLRVI